MSGSEFSGCVALVVSAFHDGADLMASLHRRTKKRKDQRSYQETLVHHALDQGWRQVQTRYNTEVDKFGTVLEKGDDPARDQLLCLAVAIHSDIIRSLQIATEVDNALLDLVQLHETAVTSRYDAINAIDHLCHRLEAAWPLKPEPGSLTIGAGTQASRSDRRTSLSLVRSTVPGQLPRAVTMTEPRSSGVVKRMFSGKRIHRKSASIATSTPYLAWLGTKPSPSITILGGTTLGSTTSSENGSAQSSPSSDAGSLATRTSTSSIYSWRDRRKSIANRFELYANLAKGPLKATSIYVDHSGQLVSHTASPSASQPTRATRPRTSSCIPLGPSATPPIFHHVPDSSEPVAHPTTTCTTTITSFDRPCSSNNYWGFCKGAWATCESVSAGLKLQLIPNRMYGRTPHWACKSCSFTSPPLNRKKELPDKITVSETTGIAYRWLLLARSHVKCKDAAVRSPESYTYGCIFCAAESRDSGTYGDVENLMVHVMVEHSRRMTQETMNKTRCIEGRIADKDEEWDVNILGMLTTCD